MEKDQSEENDVGVGDQKEDKNEEKEQDEEQELRDVVWRMVVDVQIVWFERWDCLQDGWCCSFTCGSCTLYLEREDMSQVEWMAMMLVVKM